MEAVYKALVVSLIDLCKKRFDDEGELAWERDRNFDKNFFELVKAHASILDELENRR